MAYGDQEQRKIFRYGQFIYVVASEGGAHDWAAYAENGYTRKLGNSWAVIKDHGNKLFEDEAASAFPGWDEGELTWRP